MGALKAELLLETAKSSIRAAEYCFLITLGEAGEPNARLVQPFEPEEDMTIWADGRIDDISNPGDSLRRTPRLEYEWSELFGPHDQDEALELAELAETLAFSEK